MKRIARMIRADQPFSFNGRRITANGLRFNRQRYESRRTTASGISTLVDDLTRQREYMSNLFYNRLEPAFKNQIRVFNDLIKIIPQADTEIQNMCRNLGYAVKTAGMEFDGTAYLIYSIEPLSGNNPARIVEEIENTLNQNSIGGVEFISDINSSGTLFIMVLFSTLDDTPFLLLPHTIYSINQAMLQKYDEESLRSGL